MAEITVVGGICADISAAPYAEAVMRDSNPSVITVRAGGVGFNISSRLASLGHKVRLVCALGEDPFAGVLRSAAAEAGVELSLIAAERSGVYVCINGADGDMREAFSDLNGTEKYVTNETLGPLLGAINAGGACVLDGNLTAEAIGFLAENVTVPIFADPVSTKKAMRFLPVISRLFAFKPNIYEARALTGRTRPEDCADALIKMGCGAAFVSCGAEGLYYAGRGVKGHAAAVPVAGCTTGAGDSAGAMLLHRLLEGADIRSAAEDANRFAAQAIMSR